MNAQQNLKIALRGGGGGATNFGKDAASAAAPWSAMFTSVFLDSRITRANI